MPGGADLTAPWPAIVTVNVCLSAGGGGGGGCSATKVAVTVASAFIATGQSPAPEQAPLHPSKRQPWSGVAESVTLVPSSNGAEQDDPQSIPAGDDRIVPEPFRATVSACWFGLVGTSANAASSSRSRSAVNWQAPLPPQLPLQPENLHPPSGEAVAVTRVPFATGTTHLSLHCWPVESCTAPWPETWTVTCWVPGPTLPLPVPGPHAAVRTAIAAAPVNRCAMTRSMLLRLAADASGPPSRTPPGGPHVSRGRVRRPHGS